MNTHTKAFSELLTGLTETAQPPALPTMREFNRSNDLKARLRMRDAWRKAWADPAHPEHEDAKWNCIVASMNQDIADYDNTAGRLHPQRDYDPQPQGYGE